MSEAISSMNGDLQHGQQQSSEGQTVRGERIHEPLRRIDNEQAQHNPNQRPSFYSSVASFGESMAQLSLDGQPLPASSLSKSAVFSLEAFPFIHKSSKRLVSSRSAPERDVPQNSVAAMEGSRVNQVLTSKKEPTRSVQTKAQIAIVTVPTPRKEGGSRHEHRHMWSVDETDALVTGCTKVSANCTCPKIVPG